MEPLASVGLNLIAISSNDDSADEADLTLTGQPKVFTTKSGGGPTGSKTRRKQKRAGGGSPTDAKLSG